MKQKTPNGTPEEPVMKTEDTTTAGQNTPFRVYFDQGQIVKLNTTTKERYAIFPKALRLRVQRGDCPPFWDDKEVLALLGCVLPDPH